jgi:anti-sigma regulatory factor (Ser/Thr protein kinase)
MRASITLRGKAGELVRLEAFAETFTHNCGLADDERARLLVILEELFTNVVEHGYGGVQFAAGSIAITLGWKHGLLTIDFVDDGPPFDPLAHSAPDLDAPAEQRPIGGLGITIVRAFVDRARYCRKGDRNHLHLVRRLAPAVKDVPPG